MFLYFERWKKNFSETKTGLCQKYNKVILSYFCNICKPLRPFFPDFLRK